MAERTMWAPWRMEYIRGPKSAGCIFCEYPAEPPSRYRERLILCVRRHAFVILNRYPFAAGHLMVVPRRHASDLSELSHEEYVALFDLVRCATVALKAGANAQGINVGLNLGAAAGAGIAEHLHVHLVPRWPGDLNFMPVIGGVHVMPEALDATYARLAPHFAPLVSDDAGEPSSAPSDATAPAAAGVQPASNAADPPAAAPASAPATAAAAGRSRRGGGSRR